VVTSATLDGEKFSAYFHACPVFHVSSCVARCRGWRPEGVPRRPSTLTPGKRLA
jgi:hypothetical protein